MEPPAPPPNASAVCLVADWRTYELIGPSLRYLLVGLFDEPILPVLVGPAPAPGMLSSLVDPIVFERPQWPFRGVAFARVLRQLRERIEEFRAEESLIVHALGLGPAETAADIAAELDAELVLTLLDTADTADFLSSSVAARASTVIAPGRHVESAITTAGAPRPCRVIPFGLPIEPRVSAFGDPGRAATIVYCGPLAADSGVDRLLRAVAGVRGVCEDVMLFVIGTGLAETELRRLSVELRIDEAVTFVGWLNDYRPAILSADIVCIPRRETAASSVPIQALAAGTAVVAADGGVHDALVHGETACLFNEADTLGFEAALRHLLLDRETARAMATRGQAYARQSRSAGGMVAAHLDVYQQALLETRTLPFRPPSSGTVA